MCKINLFLILKVMQAKLLTIKAYYINEEYKKIFPNKP
jgi:hypothetical protein